MPIEFDCPQCAHHYRVADSNTGKRIRCKQCQGVISVPGEAALAVSPPAAPQAPRPMGARPALARPAMQTPFGMAPVQLGGPRGVNVVFLIGAALMLVGFMTPWISFQGIISISGFQIPIMINKLATMMGDKSGQFIVLYFMYFIPVACVGAAVEEFVAAKQGRNRWYVRLVAALSPLISFLLIIATFPKPDTPQQPEREQRQETSARQGGPSVMDFIGFGAWLSLGGFAVSLAGVFTSPKPKPANQAFVPRPRREPIPGANAPRAPMPRPQAGPRAQVPRVQPRPVRKPKTGTDDSLP